MHASIHPPIGRRGAWACAMVMALFATSAMAAPPPASQADAQPGKGKPVLAGPQTDASGDNSTHQFNGRNRNRGDVIQEALKAMDLTDAQREQVKTIIIDTRAARQQWQKENGEKLKSLQADLNAANEAKDKEKAKDLQKQIKSVRSTAPSHAQYLAQLKAALTPEQRQAFDAKVKEIQQKRREEDQALKAMMADMQAQKKAASPDSKAGKPAEGNMMMNAPRDGEPKKPATTQPADGMLDL